MAVGIKVMVSDHAYLLATGLALVYADDNWNDFAKSMGMDKSEDVDEMHAELQHFIAHFLFENTEVLAILFAQWGSEKVSAYIESLVKHEHKNAENNGKEV